MKIPKLKRGDAIEVLWTDAHFGADKGWIDLQEFIDDKAGVTIRSRCTYISRDKQYLYTVADDSTTPGMETGVMRDLKIPIGCVKEIHKLRR